MTQLSKERLEEIAKLARKENYNPCAMHMTNLIAACDSEAIEEMARRLLSVEEQEPVGFLIRDKYTPGGYFSHKNSTVNISQEDICEHEVSATPLYAAPPAPQPVQVPHGWKLVPIELTDEIAEAIAMEARCCGGIALDIYEAMLAAAPQPDSD